MAVDRARQAFGVGIAGDDSDPAVFALEYLLRPAQPVLGEKRRLDPGLGDGGLGARFHHRDFAAVGLGQRVVVGARDRQRIRHRAGIEAEEPGAERRARESDVGRRRPPAALPQVGLSCELGQAKLDLIADDQRPQHVPAGQTLALGHRQRRSEIGAGMGGIAAEEIVVVIEVAQHGAVGQRRQGAGRRRPFAEHRRFRPPAELGDGSPDDPRRRTVETAERAGQGIEHQPFGLVDHLRRQVLVADGKHQLGHFIADVVSHRSSP